MEPRARERISQGAPGPCKEGEGATWGWPSRELGRGRP